MDIDEAREFFSNDRFATENGITREERDERHAVASLALAERHRNAHGGVMGGAIFSLADFAFAALTNGPDRSTVAQQVSVSFLAAPSHGRLYVPSVGMFFRNHAGSREPRWTNPFPSSYSARKRKSAPELSQK